MGLRTRPGVKEGATPLLSGRPHPVRGPSRGRAVRPQKDQSECPERKRTLDQAGSGFTGDAYLGFLRMDGS